MRCCTLLHAIITTYVCTSYVHVGRVDGDEIEYGKNNVSFENQEKSFVFKVVSCPIVLIGTCIHT